MPMTSPFTLKSAPPELPGFTAASVWSRPRIGRPSLLDGSVRSRPLITPVVNVPSSPNGLPIAATTAPTLTAPESPSVAGLELARVERSTLTSADVVAGVGADDVRGRRRAVRERDGDVVEAADDVVVREDVAVCVQDDARAEALRLVRLERVAACRRRRS